jgi:MFS family permease
MEKPNPLSNPVFRNLFIAQVIALVGTGLSTVGLSLLAYDLAGDNAGRVLGIALAYKMIAYVFFAPLAGAIVHRFDRKPFLISLDIIRALLVLLIPFVTQLWHIYALIFLLNLFSAGFKPVFQAVIPDILENEEQYGKALSYSRLAYDLESLLSPTFAAIALFFFTYSGLFVCNSIAFICSVAIIVVTMIPTLKPTQRTGTLIDEISFGIKAYFKTPRLRALLILYFAVACSSAMLIVNTIIYVKEYLGGNDSDLAIFFAFSGFGSMLSALYYPKLSKYIQDKLIVQSGTLLMSIGLVLMSTMPSYSYALPCWFLVGIGWSLVQTPSGKIVNMSALPLDRISYFSAQFALSHLCWLITYPITGFLVLYYGFSFSALFLSCVVLTCFIFSILFWPDEQDRNLTHSHELRIHTHEHNHKDQHHLHLHNDNQEQETHDHEHEHEEVSHKHKFVIDLHHQEWPKG